MVKNEKYSHVLSNITEKVDNKITDLNIWVDSGKYLIPAELHGHAFEDEIPAAGKTVKTTF